eukprot:Polyplicarium_translucidae@DN2681_c0_g1_i2.p1
MHVLANVYQWELQYDCGVKHSPTGFLPNWEVITPIFAVEDGEKKDVPLSVVMRHEIDGTAEFVVATRGTRTTFEWRMALTPHLIFETAGAPGGFHSGVGNFALPLLAALQVLIDSEPLPIRRIIFAGHSLGGAVSAVAAALLDPRGAEVHAVTFGGPRVGDDKFYAALRRTVNVRSVEAAGDPIPRLPCGAMPACPAADSDILAFRASYFFGDPVGVVRVSREGGGSLPCRSRKTTCLPCTERSSRTSKSGRGINVRTGVGQLPTSLPTIPTPCAIATTTAFQS